MKNILIVVDERKIGGVSILLEDMMKMINHKNFKFDILCLHDNGNRLNNLPDNVNLIFGTKYFDAVDLPIKEALKTKNVFSILKKIRLVFEMKTGLIGKRIIKERNRILRKKYDVEIAFKDGFTALFVGFGNCNNKIHWLHYDYKSINPNSKYDKLFKKILQKFNRIIAVSEGVMNDFNEIYHLEDKTEVIENLVNVERIKKMSDLNTNTNKNNNVLKIISVGRLHYTKSYDRLISAIDRLNSESLLNNVEFRIYGDGPEKEVLSKKVQELNLTKYIKFMGSLDNPYPHIKNSDLFVLPSIYEAFGLVVIESMTLGIPVIATKTSATEQLINNGVNGIVVDNSIDGIYNGLKKILINPKILEEYRKNLKNYDYNIKNKEIIKQIEKLFR